MESRRSEFGIGTRTGQNEPSRCALSLLSTKIAAVALLVFGVPILVGLYRYTAKLATFCESRADLLQLLPATALNPSDVLSAALIPQDVDFDKLRKGHLALPDLQSSVTQVTRSGGQHASG
jgi:hypothetical protein